MADIVLSVGGNVTELNNALDAALSRPRSVRGINAQSFTEPLGRITGKASEFQKSLEASNARVIAFGASAGAIFAVKSAFDTLVRATIDVEKSINSISTILGSSGSSLKAFSNDLFAVASQTGTSFKDASAAAQEFARQGLTASETILRTRDALILARISGMDFADAAKSITTAINAFASEALTSTDIINRLIAADTNFAVSAGDLAEALSRVGSSSEDANVSLNETISLVTSAAQITGRSGSVIGNAFKSIFTRLQRPQVLEDLEKIGILTRNAAGESLPLISVLRNLAGAYDSLAPGQKSFVAETVGGIYQINTLKAVLGDLGSGFSVYDSALKTVTNSTGSAIARNEQLNQTISSRLNETLNTLVKTASKVGDLTIAPTLGGGLSGVTSFLEGISKTLDSEGIGGDLARGILKGIGGILSGPGLQFLTFTFLKLFQNLTTFAAKAVADFSGMNSKAKQLELTQVQVLMAMAEQPGIMQQVRNGTMSVEQASRQVFGNIVAQNNAMQAQLALARLIAQAGTGAGLTVAPPKYRVIAAGYIPNFNSDFAMEEAQAKSLGARNPKARFGKGRIGGQPFIMNSEETEIPNFGKNGDSAVIPHYSKGFVPNFAENLGIKGLAGKELAYNFSKYVESKTAKRNEEQGQTAPYILAGRVFESLLQGDKTLSLIENKSAPDVQRGKYKVSEAKLSLSAALNDEKVVNKSKIGDKGVTVPGSANKSLDKEFKKLGIPLNYAKEFNHRELFRQAREIIERYSKIPSKDINANSIDISGSSAAVSKGTKLSAAGYIPNFADLRFKKSFDKEFGITRLTGISGKDIVGDIEYSGKSTREIEAFDINEKYRGKGLAKQFYGAMGKGKIKGTLLPNYDKDGNVFFPQLSRANSAKSASVTHYGPMEDFSKITVEQFQQLIAKNKSDKNFWKKNSFDLNTSHARGYIPNFASMAGLEVENPRNKMIARAMRQGSPQTARTKAAAEFEKISAEFLKATLEKYQGTKVLSSFSTSLLSGVGTGMSGGKSFAGYDVITKLITENPELAEKLGIKTGTISRIATSVKGGSGGNLRIGDLEKDMAKGNILLEKLGSKRPLAQVLAVRKGNLPDFVGKSLAGGHIPNFSNALSKAVDREMGAGYSSSQVKVGSDPSLISSMNPAGIGVYNSTEGSLGNGIGLARKAGINPKTKGMAEGYVPNFADVMTSVSLGASQYAFSLLGESIAKLVGPSKAAADAVNQANEAFSKSKAKVGSYDAAMSRVENKLTQTQKQLQTARNSLPQVGPPTAAQASSVTILEAEELKLKRGLRGLRSKRGANIVDSADKRSDYEDSKIAATTRGMRLLGQTESYKNSKMGKMQAKGQFISAGISEVGGMASELVKSKFGADKAKAVDEFTSGLTTAAQVLQTIPGPLGYVAAAGVAIYAAGKAVDQALYGFAEAAKKNADLKLSNLNLVDIASNALAQAMNGYEAVLSNTSATTEETLRAQKKYSQAVVQMGSSGDKELMSKLSSAGSMKEKQAVLSEAGEKRASEKQKYETIKSYASKSEEYKTEQRGYGNIEGEQSFSRAALMATVPPVAMLRDILGKEKNAGKTFFSENPDALEGISQQAIASGNSKKYVEDISKELKFDPKTKTQLVQFVQVSEQVGKKYEALAKIQDSRTSGLKTEQQALERLSSSLKNSQNSLKNFAGTMSMISAQNVAGRMRLGAKASVADAQMNAARSLAPEIEGSDSRAIKEVRAAMSVLKSESSAAFKNINADLAGGLVGELMDPLKQARSGAASAGLGSQNLTTSTAVFNNTAKAMDEVVKGFEKSGGFEKSNPQQIISNLQAAISKKADTVGGPTGSNLKALGLNLTGEKVQELIAQKNNTLQEKTIEELQKIGQTALEQKNKLSELKNQKVLGAFGGLGSFMQDFGQGKRAETRRAISETRSGIGEVQGRGSINLMKLLSQDMQLSGSDPRMKALKEKGVQARTSDIMKSSKIYEQAGFGKLSNADARYIAEKQVTKEVDNKTIEELSAEEVEISKETNKILADLSAKTGVKVTESNMMDPSFFSKIQNKMSSVQDSQSTKALESASFALYAIGTQLTAVTAQLGNIKSKIDVTIAATIKDTPEGKTYAKAEDLFKMLKDDLEKQKTIQAAKS